jgi:hypothetical protein
MLIKYKIGASVLNVDGIPKASLKLDNITGESICFIIRNGQLELAVPFLVTRNIFYRRIGDCYYISTNISEILDDSKISESDRLFFKQHGFFPLDATGYQNIGIVCSYLKYRFSSELQVELDLNVRNNNQTSIEGIGKYIELSVKSQIESFRKQSDLPVIVPLSGGMDSRLLLWIANKYDDNIIAVTHGENGSGDVVISKRVVKKLFPKIQHRIFALEDLPKKYLLENLESCDQLLPIERVLYPRIGEDYGNSLILSGLYGDVILADTEIENQTFSEYINSEGVHCNSAVSLKIAHEYDKIQPNQKLNRVLLRCQKLTRLGLNTIKAEKVACPFVELNLILMASKNTEKNLYRQVVNSLGASEIFTIIHQTTSSYFHHPQVVRLMQKAILKLIRHPYTKPYYTAATIQRLIS